MHHLIISNIYIVERERQKAAKLEKYHAKLAAKKAKEVCLIFGVFSILNFHLSFVNDFIPLYFQLEYYQLDSINVTNHFIRRQESLNLIRRLRLLHQLPSMSKRPLLVRKKSFKTWTLLL